MEQNLKFVRAGLLDISSEMRSDWEQLADSAGANFSLYPAWSEVIAESQDIAAHTELIAAYLDDEIVGILPVNFSSKRVSGILWRSLGLLSNRISYHNTLLSRLAPCDAIRLIVDEGVSRNVDVIHLAGISDDTGLGKYLKEDSPNKLFRTHTISGDSSPYLQLDRNWDELLATKPKKFRYKLRKRAAVLDSSEKTELRWFRNVEDCSTLLDAMRAIEQNSWKKDAGISIFERQHEGRYHELLLPFLAMNQAMFANVLYEEEVPIAYNLCCVWNGWVGQLKTSFDKRFAELSPGSIVIDHAIQHAIELDADEFDFLGDTDPHKLAWTKSVRPHSDHFLYLRSSIKGNLIGFLKSIRLRFSH